MSLSRHKLIIFFTVLVMILTLSIRPSFKVQQHADRTSLAKQLIDQATLSYNNLRARTKNERTEQDYLGVIALFKQGFDADAEHRCGDEALLAMAQLAEEMAVQFQKSRYHYNAIDYYQQLTSGYPASPHRALALIGMARIFEKYLTDRPAAVRAYAELAQLYPNSISAREASANLVRLSAPLESSNEESSNTEKETEEQLITSIRNFAGPDYARVVIDLNAQVNFEKSQNSNGKISLLMRGVKLAPTLGNQPLVIPSTGLLKQINAETLSDAVRLNLECAKLQDYAVFTLNNPQRLVIDMRGVTDAPAAVESETIASNRPAIKPAHTLSFLRVLGLKVKRIVIDAGHGGHDSGALGSDGLVEKELVLDVALKLRAMIKEQLPDIDVVMTRDRDRFVALEERTAIANAQAADLFISIHANSSKSTEASGIETYYLSINANKDELEVAARENSSTARNARDLQTLLQQIVLDDKVIESRDFAQQLQRSLVSGIGSANSDAAFNRGVKKAPFIVLIGANMPSVLAEIAFVSNTQQAQLLKSQEFRQQIAKSLFDGTKHYVEALAKGQPSVAAKNAAE